MKSRIIALSTAALLAGTMFAAGQGMSRQGEHEGAQPSAPTQNKENPGAKSGRPSTVGQAPRPDESTDKGKNQNVRDGDRNKANNQPQQGAREQERTQGQSQREQQDHAQDHAQDQKQGRGDRESTVGQNQGRGGGENVNLTSEQKTQIRETVLTGSAPRVTNVNFSVNVGTVVPRTVKVVEVPQTLVEIHPEWRGRRYFVYNDEIVIVDPESFRIIAVVVV